jgi:uncharacterized protein
MAVSIILDTNIWLDWLVFQDPGVAAIQNDVAAKKLRIVAQESMRAELAEVLTRPCFTKRMQMSDITPESALEQFDSLVQLLPNAPTCTSLHCLDPKDQQFLDLAVHEQADRILTKDKLLLKLAKRARQLHQLSIITPEPHLSHAATC